MDVANPLHPLMSCPVREWISPAAPAGHHLQAGVQDSGQHAVLKSLVKIAPAGAIGLTAVSGFFKERELPVGGVYL